VDPEILKPILAAGAAAVAAYSLARLLAGLRRPGGRLAQFARPESAVRAGDVGTQSHKVRLVFSRFGLDVSGRERPARILVWLVAGTALALVLLLVRAPMLMAPAAYVAAWFLVESQLNGAWVKLVHGMEKEIPIFLSRLASTVQIESNVLEAMHEVTETLDSKGPLREWLLRFIGRCQAGGAPALAEMQAEAQAISTSLGITVFEIGRLWETGGPGYARAFERRGRQGVDPHDPVCADRGDGVSLHHAAVFEGHAGFHRPDRLRVHSRVDVFRLVIDRFADRGRDLILTQPPNPCIPSHYGKGGRGRGTGG
jgi:hypothetical protein